MHIQIYFYVNPDLKVRCLWKVQQLSPKVTLWICMHFFPVPETHFTASIGHLPHSTAVCKDPVYRLADIVATLHGRQNGSLRCLLISLKKLCWPPRENTLSRIANNLAGPQTHVSSSALCVNKAMCHIWAHCAPRKIGENSLPSQ